MKYVYIIMENRYVPYEFDCDVIYRVFSSPELAEQHKPANYSEDCDYSYYILTQEVTEE